ncbi:PTS sugar transporter subunit IIB [Pseudoclavibacter helvolus]|uniref:PTS sugar transporter subunit IIB n=1 Tax=Pseudoclavibacter helvolus TaxID=255205 RepID=UPI003C722815
MIQLLRVDHRLIHGQVVMSWVRTLDPTAILIANDSVPSDELRKSTLKLAKPADVKLVIKTVADSIEAINSGKTDSYRLLILTDNVTDAIRLADGCPDVQHINLGGTKRLEGTTPLTNTVNLTDDELEGLRALTTRGIEVEARAVATDRKVPLAANGSAPA